MGDCIGRSDSIVENGGKAPPPFFLSDEAAAPLPLSIHLLRTLRRALYSSLHKASVALSRELDDWSITSFANLDWKHLQFLLWNIG